MHFTMNLKGQVNQMRLPKSKALWPLFETIVNSIQSLEETKDCADPHITVIANRPDERQIKMQNGGWWKSLALPVSRSRKTDGCCLRWIILMKAP